MSVFTDLIAKATPLVPFRVLFYLIGANMNTTADQALIKNGDFSAYTLGFARATNASVSMTTASGSIYTAAAKGGIAVAGGAYSGAADVGQGVNLAFSNAGIGRLTASTLYLSLTTPQGAAATMDFYLIGQALP